MGPTSKYVKLTRKVVQLKTKTTKKYNKGLKVKQLKTRLKMIKQRKRTKSILIGKKKMKGFDPGIQYPKFKNNKRLCT